jgi:hypothetical protein
MFQATYTFKNSSAVVDCFIVNLIDNPGVRAWAYAVLLNNKQRRVTVQKIAGISPHNPDIVDRLYRGIIECLTALDSTQFRFTQDIPLVDQVDQQFLNRLHRYFTQCCLDIWKYEFRDYELRNRLNPIFQRLNMLIHNIECFYETPQKKQWDNRGKEINFRLEKNEISFDMLPFIYNHTTEPTDLILDAHILGKTLLESYICNDNPDHWDTSGHVRTSGGAVALLSTHRRTIYQQPEFKAWLTQHGLDQSKILADFSLGNFVNNDLKRLEQLSLDQNFNNLSCEIDIIL